MTIAIVIVIIITIISFVNSKMETMHRKPPHLVFEVEYWRNMTNVDDDDDDVDDDDDDDDDCQCPDFWIF